MIKIKLRRSLVYLLLYYVAWFYYVFYGRLATCPIFFELFPTNIGKIIGGLIAYLYQNHFIKKKKGDKIFGINLIHNVNWTKAKDSKIKIAILIFFASFFYQIRLFIDCQFAIYMKHSPSIEFRLSSLQTISASLICTYALGFEMKKHHKLSLIIISIFLVLTFIIEIIYKSVSINIEKFVYYNLLILYYYICDTFSNSIEKYLYDINYINPFLILLFEGIVQLILSPFYIILNKNVIIAEFNHKCKFLIERKTDHIIIMLLSYLLMSIVTNVYKIYCNVMYSPMVRSLFDYLLNPIIIIIYFFVLNDFDKKVVYLVISIIICIIISFFGCVYNEYIILKFCDLDRETKDSIIERAENNENMSEKFNDELDTIDNDNEINKDDNKNDIIGLNETNSEK